MTEQIPAALDGERLDRVVALLTGRSRAESAALVAAGRVSVAGAPVTQRAARVAEGDEIEVDLPPRRSDAPRPDARVDVPVVYEDADVVVVDKPAGLVVHPGSGNAAGTLVNGLLARYPEIAAVGQPARPGIVHRLDKGTSGLLVVARTRVAYEALVAALASRRVERRYLALVWAHVGAAQGVIDAPVGRSARSPTRMAVAVRGRSARTRYEVVERFVDPTPVTLLRCSLETGRTHQIRVHLAAIGHPVVGDAPYGGARPALPMRRPFLHAAALEFAHPVSGDPMAFDSPLPLDLATVVEELR